MPPIILILCFSLWIRTRRSRQGWAEEFMIAGVVSSLISVLPWLIVPPLLFCYFVLLAIDDGLHSRLGLRLRPELYSHFFQIAIFRSSIASLRKNWIFPAAFLGVGAVGLVFMRDLSSWILNACLAAFIFVPSTRDHFLTLAIKDLNKRWRKRPMKSRRWAFSTENALFLSKDYPLLRITKSFKGRSSFSIPIPPKDRPHLIFFFLESFRAKSVSETVTPHFCALRQKGIYFSQFYTNSNTTSLATVASLCGIPPSMTPSYQHYYVGLPLIGLPRIMKSEGYHPAVIQGAHLQFQGSEAFYRSQGFETIIGKREIEEALPGVASTSWGIHDEALVRYGINWLKKQKTPVFLNLFSITNHHPWISPPGWERKFSEPYLNTMAYTDWALQEWMRQLEEADLLQHSILFILGDHGQSQGEHDRPIEVHRMLYEEDVRVPLLILAQGLDQPRIIDDPCSQMDLLPTILDLFRIQAPHHSLGTSLMRKKKRSVFMSCPFEEGIIALRQGRWKGIIRVGQEELFDIRSDPDERINQPRSWRRLKGKLQSFANAVQELYDQRAWAPPSCLNEGLHFAPPRDITDEELQEELRRRPSLFSLDLTSCANIRSLKIRNDALKRLNLTHCWRVSDPSLDAIRRACPHLATLNLSHCSLITDRGVQDLLQGCRLEELSLQGLDDLRSLLPTTEPARHLRQLNLLECPQLDGSTWAPWIARLGALHDLRLCCAGWTNQHFLDFAPLQSLRFLVVADAAVSEEAILPFIAANRFLVELTLDHCPEVGDRLVDVLQDLQIQYLTLKSIDRITDEGLKRLKDLPLQWLRVQDCPLIRGEGLAALQRDGITILFSPHSTLIPDEIERIRAAGIYVVP
ncbi:MAG: Sulfatase protein [Parachlamydiales bacterium]|nr:Sulfatase protein [Parachlamydiales bacterium]